MTAPGFMAGMGVPAKAYIEFEDKSKLACHFNPKDLTVHKSVEWKESGNLKGDAPTLHFQRGKPATYKIKLIFDTTAMRPGAQGTPVTKYTSKLLSALKIDSSKTDFTDTKGRPPFVTFHWGNIHSFKAVIQSLDINYIFFSPTGTPLRAEVDVTFHQAEEEKKWWKQNPTSGTPHPQELHTVQPGETLDRIANQHFNDSSKWRLIADANRVLDPMRLRPGTVLTIPDLEEMDDA